mgnify:FL=1
MLNRYLALSKVIFFVTTLSSIAYLSYDYGVMTTEVKSLKKQDALWEKIEQTQDEAYKLAIELAKQKQSIEIQYRTIEKEVIKYAQNNSSKQCIVNDADWMHIRAESVRAHNRAIGVQQPSTIFDDTTKTTADYERDAEVLAEDVANLKTCSENAQKLLQLQTWILASM